MPKPAAATTLGTAADASADATAAALSAQNVRVHHTALEYASDESASDASVEIEESVEDDDDDDDPFGQLYDDN